MDRRANGVRFLLLLLIIGAVPVLAARPTLLVSKDYAVKGDGLLTYDTVTKLEWLDLTATKGLTGTEVLAGVGGWAFDRFRYPTGDELTVLFLHAGLGTSYDVWKPELYAPARDFLSLIGATRVNEPNGPALYSEAAGVYRNPNAFPGNGMSIAVVATFAGWVAPDGTVGSSGFVQHWQAYHTSLDERLPTIGHWLVRNADKGAGPCR